MVGLWLQCCGAPVPIVPILANPIVWLIAITALTSVMGRKKKK